MKKHSPKPIEIDEKCKDFFLFVDSIIPDGSYLKVGEVYALSGLQKRKKFNERLRKLKCADLLYYNTRTNIVGKTTFGRDLAAYFRDEKSYEDISKIVVLQ